MADGLSEAILDGWLNTLKGTAYTAAAAAQAQLHTGSPGSAGTSAVSAGDSSKKALTFTTSTARSLALTSAAGPWTNGGTGETITNISLWTGANVFVGSITLTASKTWASGDTLTLNTCTVTASPLAS